MRLTSLVFLIAAFVSANSPLLTAGLNQYGVADRREITFENPVRVGDVLLPSGNYEVLHIMDAETHVMLFSQLNVNSPAQARVPCHLVPLHEKATLTRQVYTLNPANERVLQILVFKGDRAQHEF